MIKFLIFCLLIYVLIASVLYFSQRRVTFNKSGIPKKPEDYGLNYVNEEYVEVSKNIKLLNWYSPPKNNKPIIVYFHGNSFDIGERAFRIKNYIDQGYGVLLNAYRGYSGNSGNPTEEYLYKDSKKIISWLKEKLLIDEKKIILYGESLGTGVVVELAQNINYKAVILEAPFTSVTEVAQKMYPIFPVKYLIWDKFDNLSKINNLSSPILFLHGKKDEIVPFEMGLKLYQNYNNKKMNVFIDEAMHNNLYEYGIANKVIEFINKH